MKNVKLTRKDRKMKRYQEPCGGGCREKKFFPFFTIHFSFFIEQR
jgi:hypothetical protein